MRRARQSVVTIALAAAAACFCSGCLVMMIPSAAYSGYKYVHDRNETAANTSGTQSNKSATPARQQNVPDNSIE